MAFTIDPMTLNCTFNLLQILATLTYHFITGARFGVLIMPSLFWSLSPTLLPTGSVCFISTAPTSQIGLRDIHRKDVPWSQKPWEESSRIKGEKERDLFEDYSRVEGTAVCL